MVESSKDRPPNAFYTRAAVCVCLNKADKKDRYVDHDSVWACILLQNTDLCLLDWRNVIAPCTTSRMMIDSRERAVVDKGGGGLFQACRFEAAGWRYGGYVIEGRTHKYIP